MKNATSLTDSVNESKLLDLLDLLVKATTSLTFSFYRSRSDHCLFVLYPQGKVKKKQSPCKGRIPPIYTPPNPFISFYLDKETSFGHLCLQFLALCHIVQTKPKPSPPIETLLQTACLAAARCRFPSKKSEKGTKVVAKMASQL